MEGLVYGLGFTVRVWGFQILCDPQRRVPWAKWLRLTLVMHGLVAPTIGYPVLIEERGNGKEKKCHYHI